MTLVALTLAACVASATIGCGRADGPVTPTGPMQGSARIAAQAQTHLWGWFNVFMDMETGEVVFAPNRQAMFTANVVNFLNSKPLNLKFKINETLVWVGYIDVDIDVAITHPFPGLPQYNGYDVRGVFMGDGSGVLASTGVVYPVGGVDQFVLDDPDSSGTDYPGGGPDGYTRWFNFTEFSLPGMPLFKYTPGKMASPDFAGTATLCPYKYFADGLGTYEDAFTWLIGHADQHGQFSSGATNERNYYLRFPDPAPHLRFGYAVIADWKGVEEQYHPSNAPEAVACRIEDHSNVFYVDDTQKGGGLNLDISLFDWSGQPSAITIESTVLSSPHGLDASEMVPVGGNEDYSTWHVEVPADGIEGVEGNEYWVIAEYSAYDYSNDFGTHNLAENDPLAAYFRRDLDVSPEPGNLDPVCGLQVVTTDFDEWVEVPVEFDASSAYDPDPGDVLTYEWDFNGNGVYGEDPGDSIDEGDEVNPTHIYTESFSGVVHLRLTDGHGGEAVCSTDPLEVTVLSCPDTDMPGGMPTPHSVSYSNSCRSGITKAYGKNGEQYFIGHLRDYYGKRYGFYAMDETGVVVQNYMSPAQPDYPPTLQGMACTTTNRIYVITYTQYIYYDYVLYYVDFDEGTGFSGLLQTAAMPSISPWYFVKVTVDENDHPVALVGQGTQLAIKHWNGSSWTHIDIDDSATMYAECGYWNNGIEDIACQPVSDTYWITNRYHGYTPDYDGVPTLYVINSDGSTSWKDDGIYPNCPLYTQYSAGVDVDVQDPDCRTLVQICCGSTGVTEIATRYIRYDPFGNVTGTATMGDTAYRYELANGTVITNDGVSRYGGPLDLAGASVGIIAIPDW